MLKLSIRLVLYFNLIFHFTTQNHSKRKIIFSFFCIKIQLIYFPKTDTDFKYKIHESPHHTIGKQMLQLNIYSYFWGVFVGA